MCTNHCGKCHYYPSISVERLRQFQFMKQSQCSNTYFTIGLSYIYSLESTFVCPSEARTNTKMRSVQYVFSRMSEIGLAPGSPVAWTLEDSEKFNEIRAYSRRAGCLLRINRRRTSIEQWADHNRTMGKPWLRPMLAFAALSVNKHRTHGESGVCYTHWNDRRPFKQ